MKNIDALLKMQERHKERINISDDYYNRIAVMNDMSTHNVLESNVREKQTCERNLTESFERHERNLDGSFEKL